MKDLTLSIIGVLAIALVISLGFHWLYPRVALTGELLGLFVFVALILKLAISKLWSLRKKPDAQAGTKAEK
jgi:hypothetical protein